MRETTVGQVVREIKKLLEGEFRRVVVRGEISNLSKSYSGHWYMTLSDSNASISGALFRTDALRNPIISQLKDGEEVICSGSIGVYAPRGTFQIIIQQIIKAGKGDLLERFELLKRKLEAEGLFDPSRKKAIPSHPKKVAVITARDGAALHDFVNVYRRLSCGGDIIIVPALVQGTKSAQSVIKALKQAQDVIEGVDLIVITRGGGSLEDLWSFNDELLAREIVKSEIPIISAIGHQTDFTICDFVSDLRVETPTAAAEMITKDQRNVGERLARNIKLLRQNMQAKLDSKKIIMERSQPSSLASKNLMRLQMAQKRLHSLDIATRGLSLVGVAEKARLLDDSIRSMQDQIKNRMIKYGHRLEIANEKNLALSPKETLKRGYSVVENDRGEVVASIKDYEKINQGREFSIAFYDGKAIVRKDD